MTDVRQDTSDAKRRRLLKGALGASTVVTLGYGGSAAAASFNCVERTYQSGNPPAEERQFTLEEPPLTSSGDNWAWTKVEIYRLQADNKGDFDGFSLDSGKTWFSVPNGRQLEPQLELNASTKNNQNGYPIAGWVLAYLDTKGEPVGHYPQIKSMSEGQAPAVQSCVSSLTPGNPENFTFGG